MNNSYGLIIENTMDLEQLKKQMANTIIQWIEENKEEITNSFQQNPLSFTLDSKRLTAQDVKNYLEDKTALEENLKLIKKGIIPFEIATPEIFVALKDCIPKTIKQLSISCDFLQDVKELSDFPNLEQIHLENNDVLKDDSYEKLTKMPKLTKVEVTNTPHVQEALKKTKGIIKLSPPSFLYQYHNLTISNRFNLKILGEAHIDTLNDIEKLENLIKEHNIIEECFGTRLIIKIDQGQKEVIYDYSEDSQLKKVTITTENYQEIISLLDHYKKEEIFPDIILNIENKTDPKVTELEKYTQDFNIEVNYGALERAKLADFTAMRATIDWYKSLTETTMMSPLEKLLYIYDTIKSFPYQASKEPMDSRAVHKIIKTGNIVCAGYSALLTQVLKELGMPATPFGVVTETPEGKTVYHSRSLVHLDDNKYDIHGVYSLDATWDSQRKQLVEVETKDGEKLITTEPIQTDEIIKQYDPMYLYTNFLVPKEDYQKVYPKDSVPAIFENFNKPKDSVEEEQRKRLFPTNQENIEEVIKRTKKPNLAQFQEALTTVRQNEGYPTQTMQQQVKEIIEVNQKIANQRQCEEVFFRPDDLQQMLQPSEVANHRRLK